MPVLIGGGIDRFRRRLYVLIKKTVYEGLQAPRYEERQRGRRRKVYVRKFTPSVDAEDPRLTYPFVAAGARKFVVPISEAGAPSEAPRGFERLSDEAFGRLLKASNADTRLAVPSSPRWQQSWKPLESSLAGGTPPRPGQ